MKRFAAIVLFSAMSSCLFAQATDATVCDILKSPAAFNGKIVRVKGTVVAGFDQFVIKGDGCGQHVNAIWLSYPEGTKGKAGPAAMLQLQPAKNFGGTVRNENRPPVTLDKSKDFKQFDSLLSAPYKGGGMCLGCVKNTVTATLVGRLDGVDNASLRRDSTGKLVGLGGFGNLNAYPARLVLQSVADVSAQEIDYTKNAATAKGDSTSDSGGGDPVAAAHKLAQAFPAESPLGAQVERAAAAFGKPGDANGVSVGFGVANEALAKTEAQSDANSPDGVLFNCTLDMGRLKGDALSRAIVNLGDHVADLRTPSAGLEQAGIYELEYRGWTTTTLSAIGGGQKTLMLPGGILLWNAGWEPADRDNQLNSAIAKFLADQEFLTR
jgi:hypothetical protein